VAFFHLSGDDLLLAKDERPSPTPTRREASDDSRTAILPADLFARAAKTDSVLLATDPAGVLDNRDEANDTAAPAIALADRPGCARAGG
jgi:hypothetical protein